jgi:hypothetical protein
MPCPSSSKVKVPSRAVTVTVRAPARCEFWSSSERISATEPEKSRRIV